MSNKYTPKSSLTLSTSTETWYAAALEDRVENTVKISSCDPGRSLQDVQEIRAEREQTRHAANGWRPGVEPVTSYRRTEDSGPLSYWRAQ